MKYVVVTAVVGLVIGLALRSAGAEQVVGWFMLVLLVAVPLIGVLITLDDDLPGGLSNPGGTTPGPWRDWESWADIACRAAISGIGFAVDFGIGSITGMALLSLGLVGIVGAIKVHQAIHRKIAGHDV